MKHLIIVILFCSLGFVMGCGDLANTTQSQKQSLIEKTFNVQASQVAWTHKYCNDSKYCNDDRVYSIVKMNDGSIWQIYVICNRIEEQYLLLPPTNMTTITNVVNRTEDIRLEK